MKVLIKQIESPFCFSGVIIRNSEENCGFEKLQEDLKCFYESRNLNQVNSSDLSKDLKCVVNPAKGVWKRARVESTEQTLDGFQCRCYLVDEGICSTLKIDQIYHSLKWVWKEPCQVIKFGLHGLQPCRLVADYDAEEICPEPSKTWNYSAISFFKANLKEVGFEADVSIIVTDKNTNINWVVMKTSLSTMTINELLVQKNFCIKTPKNNENSKETLKKKEQKVNEFFPEDESYFDDDPSESLKLLSIGEPVKVKQLVVSKPVSPQNSKSNLFQNYQGICLIEGVDVPNSFVIFCQTPFPSNIIDALESCKLRRPTPLQSNCWPSICGGRDLVAIATTNTGKTLSYAVPLASKHFTSKKMTRDVRKVKGEGTQKEVAMTTRTSVQVKSVVLCSTRRSVQQVNDVFASLLNDSVENVISIGDRDCVNDDLQVALLNDCRVLVCTPFSFVEVCNKNMIPLFKIENLVFDECDVLMEEFTDEIKQIMKCIFHSLNDRDLPKADRTKPQMLMFGNALTEGVKSFRDFCMSKRGITYIHDPLQAIAYRPVSQDVVICRNDGKLETLTDLVLEVEKKTIRHVAVFVTSEESSVKIFTHLRNVSSLDVYEMDESFQNSSEIDDTPALFVVSDRNLNLLQGFNIEHGIHFEYPLSINTIAQRIISLDSSLSSTQSYVFLTETEFEKSNEIIELFKLMKLQVPHNLAQISVASSMMETKNEVKMTSGRKRMCAYMMGFGYCRTQIKCPMRHTFSTKLDSPNSNKKFVEIPLQGHIKVKITQVLHATHYWCQLIKHVDNERNKTDLNCQYLNLQKKLDDYFKENKKAASKVEKGKIVGVNINGKLHRALVLSPVVKNKPDWYKNSEVSICKYNVQLVDNGARQTTYVTSMYEISDHDILSVPYQAVEVRAIGMKPADKNDAWSVKANQLIHSKIYNKELEGHIKFVVGHTMYLDPCVCRSRVRGSSIVITDCNVAKQLFSHRFATNNDQHEKWLSEFKQKLKETCSPKIQPTAEISNKINGSAVKISEKIDVDEKVAVKSAMPFKKPIDVIKHPENKKKSEIISKDLKFLNQKITPKAEAQPENRCLLREIKNESIKKPCKIDKKLIETTNIDSKFKTTKFKLKPLSKPSVRPLKNIPLDEEEGLLLPSCAKLLRSNRARRRVELCSDIYILCCEFNFDVSSRDVTALFTALFRLKCDTERYVMLGSLIRLIKFEIPVWERISSPHIVAHMLNYHNNKVPSNELMLATLTFVDCFFEKCINDKTYKAQVSDVAVILLEFIQHYKQFGDDATEEKVFLASHYLLTAVKSSRKLVKLLKEHDLDGILNDPNLLKNESTNAVLEEISTHLNSIEKLKKKSWQPSNHDMFNYGRFDLIDTSGTDSDCSHLFDYHRIQAPGICDESDDTDAEQFLDELEDISR